MTEGRDPSKGEPEPPDAVQGPGSAKKGKKKERDDEMDVHAYQQPEAAAAMTVEPPRAMGEPEPPDEEGGGNP